VLSIISLFYSVNFTVSDYSFEEMLIVDKSVFLLDWARFAVWRSSNASMEKRRLLDMDERFVLKPHDRLKASFDLALG